MRKEAGYTLQEIMIVAVIIGIMGAMAVIPYRRTIERSRWRAARDVLEAIYAGEKVYWTMSNLPHKYCSPIATDPVPCPCINSPPLTDPACRWASIYVDDPNVANEMNYTFIVPLGGDSFTAIANRNVFPAIPCYTWSVSIDDQRIIGGTPRDNVC